MDYVNGREVRIFAIPRSGHNAIISWMVKNCQGKACALIRPAIGNNLFSSFDSRSFNLAGNSLSRLDMAKERQGEFSAKDYLIYDLESVDLENLGRNELDKDHDKFIGRSMTRIDALVLRDPFNLLASALQQYIKKQPFVRLRGMPRKALLSRIELWKQYACEALGRTSYLKNKKVAVNYNKWFVSEEERLNIARQLDFIVKDNSIDFVPVVGGGSSFDGEGFQNKGTKMKTLGRWRNYAKSELFKSLFDEEVFELSKEIFGDLPGTECLYPKKTSPFMAKIINARIYLEEFGVLLKNHYEFDKDRFFRRCKHRYARTAKNFSDHCPSIYRCLRGIKRMILS